ncbi:MFS transporter [Halobaculum sp. MBLA0143]|uniref:MFS transporter n=1 Tax=Halobaculum sp. MBLA0143 TaxID=3079933 RepID=UPI003526C111
MLPKDSLPPRPIFKYYIYVATAWGGFHVPVNVLMFRSRGLSFTEIGLVVAAGSAVTLLAEIPSGYAADRLGRRNSLLLSAGLMTSGSLVFALAGTFPAFVLAQATFVLGISFRSGTSGAWLYDTLSEMDREDDYAHVSGRGQTALLVVMGVTSVAGGYLGQIDYGLAYLATAATTAISFLAALTFREPSPTDDDNDNLDIETIRSVITEELTQPRLRDAVIGLALFFGVATTANSVLVQPLSVGAGVPEAQIGWLYATFTGVGAAVSYVTGWVEEQLGTEHTLVVAPFLVAVALGAGGVVTLAVVPGFVVMRGLQRLVKPLSGQLINDELSSVGRATALSVIALVYSVVGIPLRVAVGRATDVFASETILFGLAGLLIVAGAYLGVRMSTTRGDPQAQPSD